MLRPISSLVFGTALVLVLALALASCAHGASAPGFTLTDDSGHPWALSAQRGKSVLLTFGFTHCADTCPATLAKLARLTGTLGTRGNGVEIAFVTVDPRRDTPSVLRRFVARFDSARIVGLTGTTSQIDTVERAYHVWAQRIPGKRGNGDYDEAHSAVVFLIDAHGTMRGLQGDDDSEAAFARAVREMLG